LAQVSPLDLLKVVVKWNNAWGSQIQNVYHMVARGADTVDDTAVIPIIQDFLEEVYGAFDQYMDDDVDLIEWIVDRVVFVVDHWETIEHITEQFALTGVSPSETGAALPPGVSAFTRGRTDVSKHEGRKYFGGFTEPDNDVDGEMTATVTAAVASGASHLLEEYEVPGYDLSLTPVVLDVNQNIYRFMDNLITKAAWAYQRRRKQYRGI